MSSLFYILRKKFFCLDGTARLAAGQQKSAVPWRDGADQKVDEKRLPLAFRLMKKEMEKQNEKKLLLNLFVSYTGKIKKVQGKLLRKF